MKITMLIWQKNDTLFIQLIAWCMQTAKMQGAKNLQTKHASLISAIYAPD